jgi:hypothetical protein
MIKRKLYILLIFINLIALLNAEEKALEENTTIADTTFTNVSVIDDSTSVVDSIVILRDSVRYSADSLYYDSSSSEIGFFGRATITYESSILNSDTLKINTKQKKAKSVGPAKLQDGASVVLGDDIDFDVETKNGKIESGATKFDQGFCYGEEIRKVDDKVIDLDNGTFTTCEAEEPHFWIGSKQMRITQGDKVVIRPAVFYVNHIPIFLLPYGAFSIQKGRRTGFLLPKPGYTSGEGKIIENIGYYWHYKDYVDNTLWFDYYEKTGWLLSFENNYKKRYEFNGKNRYKFRKQDSYSGSTSYNWEIYSKHHHDFLNDKKLDMTLHFVSNKSIYDNNEDVNEELKESISSDIYYKMPLLDNTLSISASYDESLNKDSRDLTLPKVSWNMGSRPITEFIPENTKEENETFLDDISVSYRVGASHKADIDSHDPSFDDIFYESTKDSTGTDYLNNHVYGIGQSQTLSWSHKYFGWLNLSNSTTSNQIYLYRDRLEKNNSTAYDYSNSTRASFNLYGARSFTNSPLVALRHIVTPSVSFSYTPDFTKHKDKYYSAGGFSVRSGEKSRTIGMSLGQKWQIKWKKNDGKIVKMNSLLSMSSSTSYNLEKDKDRLSNINHRMTLNPNKGSIGMMEYDMKISGDITQFPKTLNVKSWGIDVGLDFSGVSKYKTYFPIKKNQFTSSKFLSADSILIDKLEPKEVETLSDYDKKDSEENWTWNISYNLSRSKESDSSNADINTTSTMRSDLNFKLTKNWSLKYSTTLDMYNGSVESESYNIIRDMHCWKLKFDITKRPGYWSYKFEFVNIKINDMKFSQSGRKN